MIAGVEKLTEIAAGVLSGMLDPRPLYRPSDFDEAVHELRYFNGSR